MWVTAVHGAWEQDEHAMPSVRDSAIGLVLLAAVLSVGDCGQSCGGQCGPPYQLQVVFRPGTPQEVAVAALRRCAADRLVARIGNVRSFHGPGEPPRAR